MTLLCVDCPLITRLRYRLRYVLHALPTRYRMRTCSGFVRCRVAFCTCVGLQLRAHPARLHRTTRLYLAFGCCRTAFGLRLWIWLLLLVTLLDVTLRLIVDCVTRLLFTLVGFCYVARLLTLRYVVTACRTGCTFAVTVVTPRLTVWFCGCTRLPLRTFLVRTLCAATLHFPYRTFCRYGLPAAQFCLPLPACALRYRVDWLQFTD